MGWIVLGVLVGIAIFILPRALKFISPEEMAVRVYFGKPVEFCDSGWVFNLSLILGEKYFQCFLKRFPKKRYNLNYPARIVISKEDWFPPPPEEEPPKGRRRWYGAQTLKVDSTVYLRFPRKGEEITTKDPKSGKKIKEPALFEIYRAGVPIDEEKLKNWTEEAVVHALRVAFGEITWKEATERLEKVEKKAFVIFIQEDGTLRKAGFTKECLDLAITEIYLPPELEKALPEVDRQRLEAEAAPYEADQRAEETAGGVIQILSKVIGIPREQIRNEIQKDPDGFIKKYKEVWEKGWDTIYREMAIKGEAYLDIRIPGGTTLESLIALLKRMPMGRAGGERQRPKKRKKTRVKMGGEEFDVEGEEE